MVLKNVGFSVRSTISRKSSQATHRVGGVVKTKVFYVPLESNQIESKSFHFWSFFDLKTIIVLDETIGISIGFAILHREISGTPLRGVRQKTDVIRLIVQT